MSKVFVAELVHGLTYFHGTKEFKKGVPVKVNAELAGFLEKVVDYLPLSDGNKVARKKFSVEAFSSDAEAQAVIEDAMEEASATVQEQDENEGVVVVEAEKPNRRSGKKAKTDPAE